MAESSANAEVREVAAADTARTYAVFCVLRKGRPVMATAESFTDWVNHRQRPEGYRVVGAFLPGEPDVMAAAGFRILHQLSKERFLYVDDLVTLTSHRSSGYAGMIFDWLVDEARRQHCEQLHLDSGHQRFDAHRFYLKRGMILNAHHFSMNV